MQSHPIPTTAWHTTAWHSTAAELEPDNPTFVKARDNVLKLIGGEFESDGDTIRVRCYPFSSVVIRFHSLLSVVIHCYPLGTTGRGLPHPSPNPNPNPNPRSGGTRRFSTSVQRMLQIYRHR